MLAHTVPALMAPYTSVAASCLSLSTLSTNLPRQGVVSSSFRRSDVGRDLICSQKLVTSKVLLSSFSSEGRFSAQRRHLVKASKEDLSPVENQETLSTSKSNVDETPNGPPVLTIIAGFFIVALCLWVFVGLLQGIYGLLTWVLGPASMVK